jgi:hypothetical protein
MKNYSSLVEVQPEIIGLWEAAWEAQPTKENPFVLTFETEAEATSMRQRLYQARKKLVKEGYPNSQNLNKLEISMRDSRTIAFIFPNWLRVAQAKLAEAGFNPTIVVTDVPPPPPPPPLPPDEDRSALAQTLKDLFPNRPREEDEV